jgi:hypothetical protein
MKTIVLDPGHGGTDPGAVNGARYEKNDDLRLALAVRDRLQAAGQRVIMTRAADIYVPLATRSAIANDNNADYFLSIHRNASENPAIRGAAAYVQNGTLAQNGSCARALLDRIVPAGHFRDIGIIQENFAVLRNTRAPAQLQEVGFISNAEDNALFDQNFNAIADGIARGILSCLGEPETPPAPPSGANATVKSIQQTLNNRYGAGLAADGIAGPLTKKALVKGLQAELNASRGAGLAVDGVFGPKTKAAIPALRYGAKSNLVYLLQAALYCKGYTSVIPDGAFGPKTEAAVRDFQAKNQLAADGIAGPATFERLFAF